VYCIQTAEDIVKLLSRPGSATQFVSNRLECRYPITREPFSGGVKYMGWKNV